MTMTNAQAALIAASNSAVRGSAVPVEPVLRRAAAFLLWLDSQEEPIEVAKPNAAGVIHKPQAIVQCEAASTNYTRCMLASGHTGQHRNSAEGEYWDDKPRATGPSKHFAAGTMTAVCGQVLGPGHLMTMHVGETTCGPCKEALGL